MLFSVCTANIGQPPKPISSHRKALCYKRMPALFPRAAEIRQFEWKDLQTKRKLGAEKVNEVLQDFTAFKTLNLNLKCLLMGSR